MRNSEQGKLYIVDDLFPHPRSVDSWRGTEFHAYLDEFHNAKVFTSLSSVNLVGTIAKEKIQAQYRERHSQYSSKVEYLEQGEVPPLQDADMAYFIFLNNAWGCFDMIERHKVPFIFELYPGGGFALNNKESDDKLEKLLQSKCFKGVIVSSWVVYGYLLEHRFCRQDQILFISGCVLNNQIWKKGSGEKRYYGTDKLSFDIAFAAYRYSETGSDKGYDIFLEIAKILHRKSDKFHFHVIGNFDKTILDVRELGESIHYYGIRDEEWFNEFYSDIDVFISPNRSSVLNEGAFDGFPTGCGVDALIRKVVLIGTDDLGQNHGQYQNGRDLYIVNNHPQMITDRVFFLFQHPHLIKHIGECGFKRASMLYSYERQLKSRIAFIASAMERRV